MNKPHKPSASKKSAVTAFEPTKVSLLVATIAASALLLFAYMGTLASS